MKPAGGQSKAVFALHTDSVNAITPSLKGLTTTIRPRMIRSLSTTSPVIHEMLYDAIEIPQERGRIHQSRRKKLKPLSVKRSARRYAGFYGPTCVVDFALIPGSSSNIVNQILKTTDIPTAHKQAILAAKSWAMNTSYGIGDIFAHAVEGGDTLAER
jgi:hypothetical protein